MAYFLSGAPTVFSEPVWEAARVYLTSLVTRWGKNPPDDSGTSEPPGAE